MMTQAQPMYYQAPMAECACGACYAEPSCAYAGEMAAAVADPRWSATVVIADRVARAVRVARVVRAASCESWHAAAVVAAAAAAVPQQLQRLPDADRSAGSGPRCLSECCESL